MEQRERDSTLRIETIPTVVSKFPWMLGSRLGPISYLTDFYRQMVRRRSLVANSLDQHTFRHPDILFAIAGALA